MKKILITGATGFIGKHLYRRLKKLHYDVLGISLGGGEIDGNKIVDLDITNRKAVKRFFTNKKFDIIFHLAATKTKENDLKAAEECILINSFGTLHLLESLKEMKGCKIIYTSTIEIYGPRNTVSKFKESTTPQPKSFYAISKLMGEYYCKKYFDEFQIPFVCLRLASVYGMGQPVSYLIPMIIEKAKNNEDIVVYGRGRGCFDFLFIEDLINAAIAAGTFPEVGVFNIGSGSVVSVKELCEKIKKIWLSRSEIIFNYKKAENCYNIQLDNQKAKKRLNYSPRYSIEKGLAKLKNQMNS